MERERGGRTAARRDAIQDTPGCVKVSLSEDEDDDLEDQRAASPTEAATDRGPVRRSGGTGARPPLEKPRTKSLVQVAVSPAVATRPPLMRPKTTSPVPAAMIRRSIRHRGGAGQRLPVKRRGASPAQAAAVHGSLRHSGGAGPRPLVEEGIAKSLVQAPTRRNDNLGLQPPLEEPKATLAAGAVKGRVPARRGGGIGPRPFLDESKSTAAVETGTAMDPIRRAGGGAVRLSFEDDTVGFDGQIVVCSVEGEELFIPHDLAALSPGLHGLLEHHDSALAGDALPLTHPDCTADLLRLAIRSAHVGALPEELTWPSDRAWAFFRCAAFLGIPAVLDVAAQGAASVVVGCHLDPDDDSPTRAFGAPPKGGLFGDEIAELVEPHALEKVRACLREAMGLGSRAGAIAAATLVKADGSPLAGAGVGLLLRVLQAANLNMLECGELQALIGEARTTNGQKDAEETEEAVSWVAEELDEAVSWVAEIDRTETAASAVASWLTAVAARRFHGCRAIAAATARHLDAAIENDLLDKTLAALEAVVVPCDRTVTAALVNWLCGERSRSAAWALRVRAVALLAQAAPPGDNDAAQVLAAKLRADDEHWALHKAAIVALSNVAPAGDEGVVAALVERLPDLDEAARLATLEALERVAVRGDALALSALGACLVNPKDCIRERALKTLDALAVRGSAHSLAIARTGISDARVPVRAHAVAALRTVAARGDEAASVELVTLVGDANPAVRDAALVAAADIVLRGHVGMRTALEALLRHKSWNARAGAVPVLGSVAPLNDADAIERIALCLEDTAPGVRKQVACSLVRVVDGVRGNSTVAAAVCARFNHRSWTVRQAAAETLASTASLGDAAALAALARLLGDDARGVREQAIVSMKRLAAPGCAVPSEVSAAAQHRDPLVKSAALQAIAALVPRGDPDFLAIVRDRIDDCCGAVREQAVAALSCLAPAVPADPDYQEALRIFVARLEDEAEAVRAASTTALVFLAEVADAFAAALLAVRPLRLHNATIVRRTAAAAHARLVAAQGRAWREGRACKAEADSPGGTIIEPAPEAKPGIVKHEPEETRCHMDSDAIMRGLRDFIGEHQCQEFGFGVKGEKAEEEDPVTSGIRAFLADAKRRAGPVCALEVPADLQEPLIKRPRWEAGLWQ
mmetsp:Transcript_87734/g.246504  ORF Transcript_87734/g.246504 Transcript_87734/m.246504 type:complete len:1154 (-) Transcript_87734:78-3539(-)